MDSIPRSRIIWFFVIALTGCALDLATKSWIFQTLGPPSHGQDEIWWLIEGYFGLQTSLNEGALFGMGKGNVVIFATLSIAAAIAIPVWLFVFGAARERWIALALALITGGILGNLYDRLGFWWSDAYAGYPAYAVRDWILWQYNGWRWPNFNLADSYLVTGAAMVVLETFLPRGQKFVDKSPLPSS